jgi:hypothetical protein
VIRHVGRRDTQAPRTPVDRLVEAGLAAYGRGELDDALVAWEQALELDPDDSRALGYVEYLKQHYDLVAAGAIGGYGSEEDLGVPFGIGPDDGDYEIEVTPLPGYVAVPAVDAATERVPPQSLFDFDEGWSLDDDPRARSMTLRADGPPSFEGLTLEMEADEPPGPPGLAGAPGVTPRPASAPPEQTSPGPLHETPADFDQASTSEYGANGKPPPPRKRQKAPSSPGFLPSEHKTDPGDDEFAGLDAATTGLGQRALGFVQPASPPAAAAARRPPPRTTAPELKVNVRTPDDHQATDDLELDFGGITPDHGREPLPLPPPGERTDPGPGASRAGGPAADDAGTRPTLDLSPEGLALDLDPIAPVVPMMVTPPPAAPAAASGPPAARTTTPVGAVPAPPPAPPRTASALPFTEDDDLGPALGEELPMPSTKPTLDFGKHEGPTRDLGERAQRDSERGGGRAETQPDSGVIARTRTQEARLRILADVDKLAPATETADQRTKRRIAALIELGQHAARSQQTERAVLAIDAAFAEDPDSAAAHKLIQQNRDAIFGVFSDYLGDFQRRPQLALALHEVLDEPLDPRAAFLLSRVDGSMTFEELLDVSGMPRLEAGRYLCQLVLRGLLSAD